jgi:hypothetical protein
VARHRALATRVVVIDDRRRIVDAEPHTGRRARERRRVPRRMERRRVEARAFRRPTAHAGTLRIELPPLRDRVEDAEVYGAASAPQPSIHCQCAGLFAGRGGRVT